MGKKYCESGIYDSLYMSHAQVKVHSSSTPTSPLIKERRPPSFKESELKRNSIETAEYVERKANKGSSSGSSAKALNSRSVTLSLVIYPLISEVRVLR